jgi:hypothetical protein
VREPSEQLPPCLGAGPGTSRLCRGRPPLLSLSLSLFPSLNIREVPSSHPRSDHQRRWVFSWLRARRGRGGGDTRGGGRRRGGEVHAAAGARVRARDVRRHRAALQRHPVRRSGEHGAALPRSTRERNRAPARVLTRVACCPRPGLLGSFFLAPAGALPVPVLDWHTMKGFKGLNRQIFRVNGRPKQLYCRPRPAAQPLTVCAAHGPRGFLTARTWSWAPQARALAARDGVPAVAAAARARGGLRLRQRQVPGRATRCRGAGQRHQREPAAALPRAVRVP